MLRTVAAWLPLVVVITAIQGCIVSRHPAGIAASSHPVSQTYTVLGPVEDSSCRHVLFGILPLSAMDETGDIIDALVKERGADALTSVTVELRQSMFAIPVVASTCTVVSGLAVKNIR